MKNFNPDKELNKIKYRKRNKVLLGIIFLLVISLMGTTFALYQVRHTKRIIYTTVSDFKNDKDIILSVYLNDSLNSNNDFPKKNSGYRYDRIECENGSTAKFDNAKWELILKAKNKDKCSVYFISVEEGTPNIPELYQGLIPVTIESDSTIKVADTTKEWYNYDNHEWANAVLVNNTSYSKYVEDDEFLSGTTISMNDILQMYVWIPRYKYELFNVDNQGVTEQEINIQFESGIVNTGNVECKYTNNNGTIIEKCTEKGTDIAAQNGDWYTHPGFTFKGTLEESGTELPGIWVGKFETNGNASALTIKPNIASWRNITIKNMFDAVRNMDLQYASNFNLDSNEVDTHMMKNTEWGAMAYLTNSKYGRCVSGTCEEPGMNDRDDRLTGYFGTAYPWNNANGVKASTTGNMYGIYDTSGNCWEYMMGVSINATGNDINYLGSGFTVETKPDAKYYDLYERDSIQTSYKRGHLGDATKEVLKTFGNNNCGWYGDYTLLTSDSYPWFSRGSYREGGVAGGTFAFASQTGNMIFDHTLRVVLCAEDTTS